MADHRALCLGLDVDDRREKALELVKRLLQRQFGMSSGKVEGAIQPLAKEQLEEIVVSASDFANEGSLLVWLQNQTQSAWFARIIPA